jgi:flagellar basal-body rod protein FlgC
MSLFKTLDVAATGLAAQNVRLNLTASNLANADALSSSVGQTYRARHPVFAAVYEAVAAGAGGEAAAPSVGVTVTDVVESAAPLRADYRPDHPLADPQGYVYRPNVNLVEEMANMISASRSYETNVEVINTSKQLLLRTLSLGQ